MLMLKCRAKSRNLWGAVDSDYRCPITLDPLLLHGKTSKFGPHVDPNLMFMLLGAFKSLFHEED